MLCLLLKNRGIVLSREQLLNKIWGYSFDGESRTVDVHVRTLRQKLGTAGDVIKTIRGVGYKSRLNCDNSNKWLVVIIKSKFKKLNIFNKFYLDLTKRIVTIYTPTILWRCRQGRNYTDCYVLRTLTILPQYFTRKVLGGKMNIFDVLSLIGGLALFLFGWILWVMLLKKSWESIENILEN